MGRAKGKSNASTKRSASKDAAVASEAALTNDSSEMENIIETGGPSENSAEAAVIEQTMITVVEEVENDGAEAETSAGERDMAEDEDHTENEVVGADAEISAGEHDVKEDEDHREEVVGADKKEEHDIGNGDGNSQEDAMEQEGAKLNIDNEVRAAGFDKGSQEDAVENNEDETDAKENKDKVEQILKQKTKRLRRKNNKKRKANETSQEKGENVKDVKKVASTLSKKLKKVASNVKVVKDLGKLDSKVDGESSKKVASGVKSRVAPQEMDIKGKDKPEPSRKKSSSKKKASSMGMIFMCNSETKKECYRYKVLGLPAGKKEMVEKVYKGMRLFLYDVDLKLMYGIYKAAGRGGFNIEPKAFKSQFPSQVRFSVLEDCLPIGEETFRQVIKKNYYTRSKFDCLLSSEQVKDLCKLFTTASKGSRSLDTQPELGTRATSKRGRAKRRGRDERRQVERARPRERAEERGYRERAEERGFRERVKEHDYRERAEVRGYRERVEERGYHEHPHLHERTLVASPLVPLAPLQPLPPPAPVQSYAYSRTLGPDPYRRDTVIQHDDSYRQSRLVELPDAYIRRETVIGHPDVYRRPAVVEPRDYYRREGIPERREYHQPLNLEKRIQDDVRSNDPYVSYRERLSYQDSLNSVHSQPEYLPPTGLRAEYHHGGLSTEYSSLRSTLPEYPSSAASSLYEYHPRRPQYRY